MKIIRCPLNGPRPADEFVCRGQAAAPPAVDAGETAWSEYLYFPDPGRRVWEWWLHAPSGHWFAALRDIERDEILETRPIEAAPSAGENKAASSAGENETAPSADKNEAASSADENKAALSADKK